MKAFEEFKLIGIKCVALSLVVDVEVEEVKVPLEATRAFEVAKTVVAEVVETFREVLVCDWPLAAITVFLVVALLPPLLPLEPVFFLVIPLLVIVLETVIGMINCCCCCSPLPLSFKAAFEANRVEIVACWVDCGWVVVFM